MSFKKKFLCLIILIDLLCLGVIVYYSIDLFASGIYTFIFSFVNVLVFVAFLLSSESPAKKVKNVSNKYRELTHLEFERYGINCEEYKKMLYEKFKLIHEAFSDSDLDVLKTHLTMDLYSEFFISATDVICLVCFCCSSALLRAPSLLCLLL